MNTQPGMYTPTAIVQNFVHLYNVHKDYWYHTSLVFTFFSVTSVFPSRLCEINSSDFPLVYLRRGVWCTRVHRTYLHSHVSYYGTASPCMDVRTTLQHTTHTMHACVYSMPIIDSACLLLLFSLFLVVS